MDTEVETIYLADTNDMSSLTELNRMASESTIEYLSKLYNSEYVVSRNNAHDTSNIHISAYANLDDMLNALKQPLQLKQEISKNLLKCSDEINRTELIDAMKYADELIKKIIGIS